MIIVSAFLTFFTLPCVTFAGGIMVLFNVVLHSLRNSESESLDSEEFFFHHSLTDLLACVASGFITHTALTSVAAL